jgi:hypothetical protein
VGNPSKKYYTPTCGGILSLKKPPLKSLGEQKLLIPKTMFRRESIEEIDKSEEEAY